MSEALTISFNFDTFAKVEKVEYGKTTTSATVIYIDDRIIQIVDRTRVAPNFLVLSYKFYPLLGSFVHVTLVSSIVLLLVNLLQGVQVVYPYILFLTLVASLGLSIVIATSARSMYGNKK